MVEIVEMRFRFAACCLAALVFTTLVCTADAVAQEPAENPFAEAVDVEVVNIEVFVADADGRPLHGLKREDFKIREGGKPVEITNFFAVEDGRRRRAVSGEAAGPGQEVVAKADPIFLAIFVDNTQISPFSRKRLLEDVESFLQRRLKGGDRIMLALYDNGGVRVLQPFTDEWRPLDRGLKEILALGSTAANREEEHRRVISDMRSIHEVYLNLPDRIGDLPCPQQMLDPARAYAQQRYHVATESLRRLSDFVDGLAGLPGRKAVLHVSDGLPRIAGLEVYEFLHRLCGGGASADGVDEAYDSRTLGADALGAHLAHLDATEWDVTEHIDQLIDRANAGGVRFFPFEAIGPRGTTSAQEDRSGWRPVEQARVANLQDPLHALAAETGGAAFVDTIDFEAAFERLEEGLESYYSLGFRSGRKADREHRLQVDVAKSQVRIRYRRSFRSKPVEEKLSDRTNGALIFGLTDNPLGVEIEIGEPLPMDGSLHIVPIRLKIPLGALAFLPEADEFHGRLSVYVAARDRRGRSAPVRSARVPIKIPKARIDEARSKSYLFDVQMLMREGDHAVAIGVHDDVGSTASYLLEDVFIFGR